MVGLREEATWVDCCADQEIPPDAVRGGRDIDGAILYVARAYHEGHLLPGKKSPTHRCAYVSWDGLEHGKNEFQILVGKHVAWEFSTDGDVPARAVVVGKTSTGEPLYTARAYHDGTETPGRVQPSQGCMFLPYDYKEFSYKEYEVLVRT